MAGRWRCGLIALVAATGIAACGSGDADSPNSADRTFLARMIPHHERAIAVARIGITSAHDSRVRAFARRIVREQTPELRRMRTDANGLHLDLASGARHARDRIGDDAVSSLRASRGTAFDQLFLRLHITSETGAAEMAEPEIRGGSDPDAVDLARGIASAPHTEIPELEALLRALNR